MLLCPAVLSALSSSCCLFDVFLTNLNDDDEDNQFELGLPDLPYFTGDPVFQSRSPASRKEAARETESPVFDYRLIHIGRMTAFDYLYILIFIMIHCFGIQM